MKQRINTSALLLCLTVGLPTFSACAAEPAQGANSAAASPTAARPARPAEDKEQLERRLASVALLLDKSSAAKQIEASANPQALAARDKSRLLRKQAEEAYKAGDLAGASRMLDQAAKTMFEGVRLAAPEQITGEKKKRDFDSKMESVKALLAAQKRITAEKGAGAKGPSASAGEAQMNEAAALAAAGKLDQASAMLDKVYLTTKVAVEGMREGDTLVRSLKFASKQEEYVYEVDRNDTHKMLIKVLLDEKRATNASLETTVKQYTDQAAVLRTSAEGMAAKKDFEAGIKLLEDSTKELVRAIRSAGVYIPG
jgi:hypothetical protein